MPTSPASSTPPAPLPGSAERRLVIAIDGPSGSGKSTVARGVARRLRLRYLDTGAMYRAVTRRVLDERIDLEDVEAVETLAEQTLLQLGTDPDAAWVRANGVDVTGAIRCRAVSNAVSAVSAAAGVRAHLLRQQRDIIGAGGGIVVEGRDIGTVVAPDAPVKIFLTASSTTRAARRYQELDEQGGDVAADLQRTQEEIDRRDRLDSSRQSAPLLRADDAIELDSTGMTPDQVIDAVVALSPVRPEPAR